MNERLLRITDVGTMIGYSETVVKQMVKANKFPPPIRPLGCRQNRWVLSEVQNWIADQVKQNREAA